MLGNVLLLARKHFCSWKSHERFDLDAIFARDGVLYKSLGRGRRCFSKNTEASSSYANGTGENPYVPVNTKLSDARVIYAVAPAMGHNQVYSLLSWAPFLFLSFWPCFAGDVYFVRLLSCKSCLRRLFFSFDGCFLHPYMVLLYISLCL